MISRIALISAIVGTTATIAHAAYIDTMFSTGADPSNYGNLIQTLDTASYNFKIPAGFTNSGYTNDIINSGIPIAELDRTDIRTDVYEVTSQQTFNSGSDSITVNPGDLAFAYRIKVVENSTNTIDTIRTFGFTGADIGFGGNGILADTNQLIGHGFFIDGAGANPAAFGPIDSVGSDLEIVPGLFGSLDWNWSGSASEQLANEEEITLILFSKPAPIVQGAAKILSPSGQSVAGTTSEDSGAPVLIPTVPTPGSIAIVALAGSIAVFRRRR